MCDIYYADCKVCGKGIDMHLADFSTGRDEVEVFCCDCIPEARADGVLWLDDDGRKVFVRSLTGNARQNADGNHPNAGNLVLLEMFGDAVAADMPE